MIKRSKGIKMVYQKISNTKEGNNKEKDKQKDIYREQIAKWQS